MESPQIASDFELRVDDLIIRASTYDEVARLNHPLSRVAPAAADASRNNYFVVVREGDGAKVTSLGIEHVRDDPQTISMDWATAVPEQRKGYASRSARALAEWLHDQPGISRIEADIVPGNQAGKKTATRAGFKPMAWGGRWRWYPEETGSV